MDLALARSGSTYFLAYSYRCTAVMEGLGTGENRIPER